MTITVTIGSRPEMDAEERRSRALRAQQVLSESGWVFDDYIAGLLGELVETNPADSAKRETLHHQISAAKFLRQGLQNIVNDYVAAEKAYERKHRNDPPADAE